MSVTADLFSAHERLEPIPMQDAEVYYLRHLPLGATASYRHESTD